MLKELLGKYDIDELVDTLAMYNIFGHSSIHDSDKEIMQDKIKEKIPDFFEAPTYSAICIEEAIKILNKKMIRKKFSTVIIHNNVVIYHEYPDFSQSYTYDEIVNTFNSFSELDVKHFELLKKHYVYDENARYYLTKKSFNSYGNVYLVDEFKKSINKCKYIYENPETSEYLLYDKYNQTLVLMDRKIELQSAN